MSHCSTSRTNQGFIYLPDTNKSTDPPGLNELISKSKGRRQGHDRRAGVNTFIHSPHFNVNTYTHPPPDIKRGIDMSAHSKPTYTEVC